MSVPPADFLPRPRGARRPQRGPRRAGLARLVGLSLGLTVLGLFAGGRPGAEAAERKTLDQFFHGEVIALEGKRLTLRYDFKQKDQLKDFTDNVPWPITRRKDQHIRWFDEKLEVVGNSGARHIAEWKGDILVKTTVRLDNDKDIGGWLSPINGADDYATFTLREFF